MSAADELHEKLFGYRPAKPGTAYERLAALVLAGLGWDDVAHDTRLRGAGRRAEHQLDITASRSDGSVQRLLVECKDWNKAVGKGTLDALVGVRDQLDFDAAMAVTTEGFTAGAVSVAVDEDVAMLVLREHREGDGPFVRTVELILRVMMPRRGPVKVLVAADVDIPTDALSEMSTEENFLHLDGSPAESLGQILMANGAPLEEGVFECSADLDGKRLLEGRDGARFPVRGLEWTETMQASETTSVSEAEGEPWLVVHKLDDQGEPQPGRLIVDRHLHDLDINEDGRVVQRDRPA